MFVMEIQDKKSEYVQKFDKIMNEIIRCRNDRIGKAITILDQKLVKMEYEYLDYDNAFIIKLYDCFNVLEKQNYSFFIDYLEENDLYYAELPAKDSGTFRYININKTNKKQNRRKVIKLIFNYKYFISIMITISFIVACFLSKSKNLQ